jgi:hypothetical protein
MFYDTYEVDKILLCKYCEGKVDIPKCLPCGKAICSLCETSIQILENNKFNCLICKKKHEMPQDGLPILEPLLELLSIKRAKVSRGKAFDSLLKLLDEIEIKHRYFKLGIENSNEMVNIHCIDLRNDVQLKAEEAIQQINELSSQIIVEIDEYEQKLIEYNKNNSKLLDEFNKNAKELETFHSVNTEYLKKYEVDEELVVKLNEKATNLIKKAELEIENLKETIFDGKIFKFEKNSYKIEKSILGITKIHFTSTDSVILAGSEQFRDLMYLCEFPIDQKWNLIYRATQDGFKASQFHSKCDDKSNTLVIIKSENDNIFGGYTEQSWSGRYHKNDQNAFIFSLINKLNKPLKMKCIDLKTAIYCQNSLGPNFGSYDFEINNDSNINTDSNSNLGDSYKHPDYEKDSNEAKSFLAGSHKFKVSEIEVYKIIK